MTGHREIGEIRSEIQRVVVALITALLLASCMPATEIAQESDESEMSVTRAAFAHNRLWILTDSGNLFSVAEHGGSRREALGGAVRDICVKQGRLVAVIGPKGGRGRWTLRSRLSGSWLTDANVTVEHEEFIGLNCDGDATLLLTSRRLVDIGTGRPRSIALFDQLAPAFVTSAMHSTRQYLYVGLNAGEWGGGLQRIDRINGKLVTIARLESGACGGLLNPACHPVHGIQDDPWKPGCIVVAVGLVHIVSDGRLLEICDERVELLYSKPIESGFEEEGELPSAAVAFFGLVAVGDSLWAAGIDGIYRVGAGGRVDRQPMPRFRSLGTFRVSFDIPGLVLLVTRVNGRVSMGGAAPMIVSR